jgi:hypothetical protein
VKKLQKLPQRNRRGNFIRNANVREKHDYSFYFVSLGTLGLLGTVTGMIKAFAALATAGTPDSSSASKRYL